MCAFIKCIGVHSAAGSEAVGLIHRMLSPKHGGDRSLRILVNYRAANEVTRRSAELQVMYNTAATQRDDPAHLGQRVSDIAEILGVARQLLHDVNLDPIMQTYDTPGWLKLADHLRQVRAALWNLLRQVSADMPLSSAAAQTQGRLRSEKDDDASYEAEELQRRVTMLSVQTSKVDEASVGRWVANTCQASREVGAWLSELRHDEAHADDPTYQSLQQTRYQLQHSLRHARCEACADERLQARLRESVQAALQILH